VIVTTGGVEYPAPPLEILIAVTAPLATVAVAAALAKVVLALQVRPHIGTVMPSGIRADWRAAVRLTVV
jgi:hypothetical protein